MRLPWNDTIITIALRNSLRHWRYSLSAIGIIALGLLSITTFRGYMLSVALLYQDHFTQRSMYGDIIIEAKDAEKNQSIGGIPLHDQSRLEAYLATEDGRVAQRNRALRIDGQIAVGSRSNIFEGLAYDLNPGETMRGEKWAWNTLAGSPLKDKGEVVIGHALARLLDCQFDDSAYLRPFGSGSAYIPEKRDFQCASGDALISMVTEKGRLNANDFRISGIMDAGFRDVDRQWIMLDLSVGQKFMGTDELSWISLKTLGDTDVYLKRLNAFIEKEGLSLKASPWQEHRFTELYKRSMNILSVFETMVLSILSGIVSLSVFNLMLKIVRERRREIGLLRSLGFGTFKIFRLFLTEATLNSVAGLATGAAFMLLFTAALNRAGVLYKAGILSEPVPFFIALRLDTTLYTALTLLLVSLLASLLAIYRAIQRPITECLS